MLREVIHIQVVKQRMEPGDIGYIRLSQFTEQADAGLKAAVKTLKQQSGGKLKALVLDLRNNPGGLLDQAVAVSGDFVNQGEIVSTRGPPHRGRAALGRQGQRHHRRRAAGGAGQRRLGFVQRDRRRRPAGPSPRRAARHPQLRQGFSADGDPAARQWRDAADHGALLHAVRPVDPGPRHHAGRGGAETREETTRFGPEREADLNHVLKNQGGTPDAPPAPRTDLPPIAKEHSEQAAGGFPEVRPGKAERDRLPAATGAGAGEGDGGAEPRHRQLNSRTLALRLRFWCRGATHR